MKRIGLLAAAFSTLLMFAVSGVMYATTDSDLQAACNTAGNKPSYCATLTTTSNPIAGKDGIINKTADIIAYVAGAVAVIMVIYGGFRYIISNGEPAKITSARQIITYALVGLVVVVLAKTIVVFVLNRLT